MDATLFTGCLGRLMIVGRRFNLRWVRSSALGMAALCIGWIPVAVRAETQVALPSAMAACSIGLAFQPAASSSHTLDPQPPDLSLPDTMKLSRLVDLAGEVSGVAYSYNPQELEQSVTLRVPGGLSRRPSLSCRPGDIAARP